MGRYAERFVCEADAAARYDQLDYELWATMPSELYMTMMTVDGQWHVLALGSGLNACAVSDPIGEEVDDVPEEVWHLIQMRHARLRRLRPEGIVRIDHDEPELVMVSRRSH